MHRILKHPPLSAPVDARHSSVRPPSRARCPEWALQTRASACSSLSRVTDEPPCAKRPLRGTGELRWFSPPCKRVVHCHAFLIVPAGSSAVDDSSRFLLAPKFLSAGPSELLWVFLHGDVCRIIPTMLLNFSFLWHKTVFETRFRKDGCIHHQLKDVKIFFQLWFQVPVLVLN